MHLRYFAHSQKLRTAGPCRGSPANRHDSALETQTITDVHESGSRLNRISSCMHDSNILLGIHLSLSRCKRNFPPQGICGVSPPGQGRARWMRVSAAISCGRRQGASNFVSQGRRAEGWNAEEPSKDSRQLSGPTGRGSAFCCAAIPASAVRNGRPDALRSIAARPNRCGAAGRLGQRSVSCGRRSPSSASSMLIPARSTLVSGWVARKMPSISAESCATNSGRWRATLRELARIARLGALPFCAWKSPPFLVRTLHAQAAIAVALLAALPNDLRRRSDR